MILNINLFSEKPSFKIFILTMVGIMTLSQTDVQAENPKLLGYAAEQFALGEKIAEDKLDDQKKFEKEWVVQLQESEKEKYAKIEDGALRVHTPGGCTVWFKEKFSGPILISYKVTCPAKFIKGENYVPRDINHFWMAMDPEKEENLFDYSIYNGGFGTYSKMVGYYASTGGGGTKNYNTTTRMRRFPKEIDGEAVKHIGLNSRDNEKEFLIKPDFEHTVNLVAADDILQYIVDGKIVYQIKKGDEVPVMMGYQKKVGTAIWDDEKWTRFLEGYFGFRMTRTHHIYRDFEVYKLNPKKEKTSK